MAIINHIIYNNLTDKEYIDKYTIGFEELKKHVANKTPQWAAKITGIHKESIEKLAHEISRNQPAAIRIGVALERHHGGGTNNKSSYLYSSSNWCVETCRGRHDSVSSVGTSL